MDRELRPGNEWPRRLSRPWRPAASSCRFTRGGTSRASTAARNGSPSTGALTHAAKNASQVETIVPALWIPVHADLLPRRRSRYSSSRRVQPALRRARLLRDHEGEPVAGCLRGGGVPPRAADRRRGRGTPVTAGPGHDYDSLPSAFGEGAPRRPGTSRCGSPSSRRAGRAADGRSPSYYGKDPASGILTARTRCAPLADHAAELARSLVLHARGRRPLRARGRPGRAARRAARGAADRPVGGDAAGVPGILARLDAMDKPWVQVVVVWNRKTPR